MINTVIEESIHIIGPLRAVGSEFRHPLVLLSQKAVLSACKLTEIIVQRDGAFKGKQFLELKEGTSVDGPITFEGGRGEVLLYQGSKVHGPISGGKLIRRD